MTTKVYLKDPAAVLDYQIDWSSWLGVDTITSSSWTASTGLTVDSDSNTTTTATVWVSGGTAGTTYQLTNRITTAGGRTDERTISISCQDR
jgi:hypothetical protein